MVTTIAGLVGSESSTDSTGPAARFSFPMGVAADLAGNLYVADTGNHTIRRISRMGVVTTLAGAAGQSGSANGTGSAARFNYPNGVAVDEAGNVYVADQDNFTIRKITPAGVVSTLAGQAGDPGGTDGTGGGARFNGPTGLAVDRAANVYVADSLSHTIRKITPAGVVTTIGGRNGVPGFVNGTDSEALFSFPLGRVTSAGVVTTLAGRAGAFGGVDGSDSATRFNFPTGVATDIAGNLYVTDSGNNTIRKGVSATRLVNLSVRCRIGTADQTPIMGFVISDGGPKPLLVRGIGPTLATLGVIDATIDPQLRLFDFSANQIQENDDWGGGAPLRDVFGSVGAFPLGSSSKDAALFTTLPSGLYSAHIAATGAAGGVALVEAYDADESATSRLINLSARTFAGVADNMLIAGFVLSGTAPKTLLIRVAGTALARLGLGASGLLIDPKLTLYQGLTRIDENDDWGGTLELKQAIASVGAFPFDADDSNDAALLVTLAPGVYTAHVAGVD